MKITNIIIATLLIASVCLNIWQYTDRTQPSYDDTPITRTDTITYHVCVPKDSIVTRYVTRTLPIISHKTDTITDTAYNTVTVSDSAVVGIPITQKEYQTEDYHLWLSGYLTSLDSIDVYRHETTITKYKTRHWGIGIHAGYGMTTGRLSPYIGIGVHYNLLGW